MDYSRITPGKGQPPHRVFSIPLTINPRYRGGASRNSMVKDYESALVSIDRDGDSRHVIASHVKIGSTFYRGGASRNSDNYASRYTNYDLHIMTIQYYTLCITTYEQWTTFI